MAVWIIYSFFFLLVLVTQIYLISIEISSTPKLRALTEYILALSCRCDLDKFFLVTFRWENFWTCISNIVCALLNKHTEIYREWAKKSCFLHPGGLLIWFSRYLWLWEGPNKYSIFNGIKCVNTDNKIILVSKYELSVLLNFIGFCEI